MLVTNEEITKFLPHREPFLFICKLGQGAELPSVTPCSKVDSFIQFWFGAAVRYEFAHVSFKHDATDPDGYAIANVLPRGGGWGAKR